MGVIEAIELPVIEQAQFPELPVLPEKDSIFFPADSPWHKAEKEYAVGILVTACVRSGQWKAVSSNEFLEILTKHKLVLIPENTVGALWQLEKAGDISVYEVNGEHYIVMTPEAAHKACAANRLLVV